MKHCKTLLGLAVAGLVLSAFSSQAQLNFGSSASIVASLTDQELSGVLPPKNFGANDGYISSWVISDTSLDSQGLIFVFQISNIGPDAVDEVTLSGGGFVASGILTGVGQTGAYSSISGLSFGSTPSAIGNTFGYVGQTGNNPPTVAFQGASLANNGGISDYLAVFTDFNGYYTSYGEEEDNFSAAGSILAPIPEANTIVAGALMLLPLGVGVVRAIRKDRSV